MADDTQKLILQLKARGVTLTKAQLKSLNATVGSTKAGMLAMGTAIAGATVAIVALGKAFTTVVKIGKEFEQSMANLKAISGATNSEMLKLENTAKKLGASTKFTASEVGALQTEFAKLGFTVQDIQNATEATLALASATGADLATSAEVAGQTVRGFGLDADQTAKIADIMALSFSRSALDMRKFTDSMKFVAPIAKMANFEMSETTAVLGVLANAGIDGSLAGTALRTIFLELSNESSKLQKAMGGGVDSLEELVAGFQRLKDDGVTTEEMLKMVNKRAVSAFSILLDGTDTLTELGEAFEDAGGSAERMANIQLDSLEGKMTILNSAFQGFSIAIFEHMEQPLKDATDSLTGFFQAMTGIIETPLSESLEEQRQELNFLLSVLSNVNTSEHTRLKVIQDIQDTYPEFISNINLEKASLRDLNSLQEDANQNLVDRIIQQKFKEELDANDAQMMEELALLHTAEIGNLADLGIHLNAIATTFGAEESIRANLVRAQEIRIQRLKDERVEIENNITSFEDFLQARLNANNEDVDMIGGESVEDFGRQTGESEEVFSSDESEESHIHLQIIENRKQAQLQAEKEVADARKKFAQDREADLFKQAQAIAFEAEQQEKIITLDAKGNEQVHQFSRDEIDLIAQKLDAGLGYVEAVQTALEESGIEGVRVFTDEAHDAELEQMAQRLETTQEFVNQMGDVVGQFTENRINGIRAQHKTAIKAIDDEEKAEMLALKKSTAFQRANTDQRKLMEDELKAKFEERREAEKASSNRAIKRQFEVKQIAERANIVMATATAVMNAVRDNPMGFGLPGSAFALAQGAIQLATVNAQQAPTMALGGMIGGSLHSAGGTPVMAEQGEFIMNRQAVENIGADRLDRINQGDGAGGMVINVQGNVMTDEFVESTLVEKLRESIRRGEVLS